MNVCPSFLSILISLATAFIASLMAIHFLKPLAIRVGLVDIPGGRKQHIRTVPVIGGMAMFMGFAFALLTLPHSLVTFRGLIAGSALMVITGVLDDFHELSPLSRLIAQLFVSLVMVFIGGKVFVYLGSYPLIGSLSLSWLGVIVTIFLVIGLINSINMTDGIDGLAATLMLVQFTYLALITYFGKLWVDMNVLLILISCLLAFMIFNVRSPWRTKAAIFMGDSGSMLLGYALVWFVISVCQGHNSIVSPITAIYIVAVPIFDTIAVIIHRVGQKRSPLKSDRSHLHHVLIDIGFPAAKVVPIIALFSILVGAIGVVGCLYGVSDIIMLALLFIIFSGYFYGLIKMRLYAGKNH